MTKLVGILNLTPDSFSDGGQFVSLERALAHYYQLANDGADMVDIGAESTRPGAAPVDAMVEWTRLAPFLQALKSVVPISIDTRHAATAQKALAVQAAVINDVSGLRDPAMRQLLAVSNCRIIVMHSLKIPADPLQVLAADADPVAEILAWKERITAVAAADGIAPARLIFDPGVGFGKTSEQSMVLIEQAATLVKSGGDWLVGHSRKSFLTRIVDLPPAARDEATLLISRQLVAAGVQYLRVHDVKRHRDQCI